ncbi:hypothetical protein [Pedobacter sp. MC2016-24]|uniref:hypothetical protein n=1 Tax=Pedobacter sp. MC2016-24 TaxID=2780090 RepID=UPI00188088D7|nr:hypothetical protein [Pedobacter sp. MC2016-24]MBE9599869.1 hypothetical protein [Pedobacter sp. MC2016-24]
MKRKSNDVYLARLNRKVIFAKFEDTTWHNENTDSAEAEYFGKIINISFPNSTKLVIDDPECYISFWLTLYDLDAEGNYEQIPYSPFDREFLSYNETLVAINDYIRTRPFSIVWQSRGRYRLLDPNGIDYTGELVSLKDARKTSSHNYKMK